MASESSELTNEQVDLARKYVVLMLKSQKYRDEDIEGLKKVNDLTKKIADTNEKILKLKDKSNYLNFRKLELKMATEKERMELKIRLDNQKGAEAQYEQLKKNYITTDNRFKLSEKINGISAEDLAYAKQERDIAMSCLVAGRKNLGTKTGELNVQQEITDQFEKQLSENERNLDITNDLIKSNKRMLSIYEEARRREEKIYDVTKKIKSVIEALTSPFTLLIGFFAIGLSRFKELDQAAADFRKNIGLGKVVTGELSKSIEKMSLKYGAFGIGVKEAYESAQAVLETFGSMNNSTEANVETVSLLKANLGVANDNAAGFVAYMQQVGGLTAEQTQNMAGFVSKLADAAKVPLNQVMKDVAHASDKAKAMTGGSVINLIKASVQARKLGVDLNKVADSARGMLDFNESINSELEASVLLGKNLSFMDARRAAFAGDIAGAQEITLRQVEKMGDFNKLNVLQQEALAKASGYSVTDLQKMIAQKKDFAKLTDKEKSEYKKLMDMKKESAKNDNSARDKLQEMQMQGTVETLTASFNTLKNSLGQIMVPFLKVLTPVVTHLAKFVNLIGEGTSGLGAWGSALATVAISATLIFASFRGIGGLLSKFGSLTGKLGGLFGKKGGDFIGPIQPKQGMFGKLLDRVTGNSSLDKAQDVANKTKPQAGIGFKTFMKNFSAGIAYLGKPNTLKGIGALLGMSAALVIAAYGFSLFSKVKWEDLAKAGVAIIGLTAAIFGLGLLMGTGVGAAAIVAGAIALGIMGAALIPFGAAALMAGAGMDLMSNGLSKMMPHLSELALLSGGLMKTAGAIYALGGAFAAFGAGQAASGLGSFVGNLLGGDRIKELKKLAELGPQLQVTANAIKNIESNSGTSSKSDSRGDRSSIEIEKKLDLILDALTSGKVAVYLDGRKVSQGLASIT